MGHYKLAFLGFGNVGNALGNLLMAKRDEIRNQYGITFDVTGIATGRHGAAINPQGLDLERILMIFDQEQGGDPSLLNSMCKVALPIDTFDFIERCGAQVLFEMTPVNYETGQPAVDYLRLALENGMHAITANKGPVVHAYRELNELAMYGGRRFFFESAVMDGAPIFSLFREALPAVRVRSIKGILNSTTNMILSRMEMGETFEGAVAYCQRIGIAETDPSGDIDGWDSAVKLAALVTVLMGIPLKPQQVDRKGIRTISKSDVELARTDDKRWKLVCRATHLGDRVQAHVAPQLVEHGSFLYGVEGTSSLVQFETDVLGLLSIYEENPGPQTTAYGCLADFLNAVRSR